MPAGPIPVRGSAGGDGSWRLPRGSHGLPPEVVVDHQRRRLLAGVAGALSEHGYAGMNVEHVVERAGVSRVTFYENFENKRDCVLVAHEEAFSRLTGELFRACAGESEWSAKVTAAVGVAIEFATRTPAEARLLALEALAPEPDLAARVLASHDYLAGLLRSGREQCPGAASLPDLTERALIGAATSVIGARLMSGEGDGLPALEPQLVRFILMPYVGSR